MSSSRKKAKSLVDGYSQALCSKNSLHQERYFEYFVKVYKKKTSVSAEGNQSNR